MSGDPNTMYPEQTHGRSHSSHAPHELRESDRVDVEAEITFSSEENFYQGFSENISEGGLFLITYTQRRCGEVITIRFTLPGLDRVIETRAEVRWQRAADSERRVNPGVGVRFLDLSEVDRLAIERFCRKREPLFYDE
jgi:uncharacterized protein (TIGR02266 family)